MGNHLAEGSKFGDLPSNQAGIELNTIKLPSRKDRRLHLYLQNKIIALLSVRTIPQSTLDKDAFYYRSLVDISKLLKNVYYLHNK